MAAPPQAPEAVWRPAYDLGIGRYMQDQYEEAAAAFATVIRLTDRSPQAYEYHARSLSHLAKIVEQRPGLTDEEIYSATEETMSDAMHSAYVAVKKFGKERWESLWVLAEMLGQCGFPEAASYFWLQTTTHPRFLADASPGQRQTIIIASFISHNGQGLPKGFALFPDELALYNLYHAKAKEVQALGAAKVLGVQLDGQHLETPQQGEAQAGAAQPDAGQPEAAQPDAAQADAAQPAQPDAAQPDAAQPEPAQPETIQPDAPQPEGQAEETPVPTSAPPTPESPQDALSADLLLRIVDIARFDDPGLPLRLTWVCQRWRHILTHTPGMWQKLQIGKGSHAGLKAEAYLERSLGEDGSRGLKELKISDGLEARHAEAIGPLLQAHAAHIERFELDIRPKDARLIFRHLAQGMSSLRLLWVKWGATPVLDFGLLPVDKSQLETLYLDSINHTDLPGDHAPMPRTGGHDWLENPSVQLANLKSLHLSNSYFSRPITSLHDLLRHTPKFTKLTLEHLNWAAAPDDEYYTRTSALQPDVRLEHLDQCAFNAYRSSAALNGYIIFDSIHAPNLTRLELMKVWSPVQQLRAPGLREALPNLRELTLGGSHVTDDLISVLASMTSLEYLNLAESGISAELIRALADGAYHEPQLLPNLAALSLSGNLALHDGLLIRLLSARSPKEPEITIYSAMGTGKVIPEGDTTPRSLVWINADHCPEVWVTLRAQLDCTTTWVSHWMGAPDRERVCGTGKWDWRAITAAKSGAQPGVEGTSA